MVGAFCWGWQEWERVRECVVSEQNILYTYMKLPNNKFKKKLSTQKDNLILMYLNVVFFLVCESG